MKNNEKDQYIKEPIWFIKLTSEKKSPLYLTPFEQRLFCLIKGLCNNGGCYANDEYFSNIFKVTIKHINKSISKLSYLGFVSISHENNKRSINVNQNIDKGSVFVYFDNKNKKVFITDYKQGFWTNRKDFENDANDFFKKCS